MGSSFEKSIKKVNLSGFKGMLIFKKTYPP